MLLVLIEFGKGRESWASERVGRVGWVVYKPISKLLFN